MLTFRHKTTWWAVGASDHLRTLGCIDRNFTSPQTDECASRVEGEVRVLVHRKTQSLSPQLIIHLNV